MKRLALRLVAAAVVFAAGWSIGNAQAAEPDFVIPVDAPRGETTIECVSGCGLAWVQRGINPAAKRIQTWTYSCGAERCRSGRVGGWLKP